MKYTRTQPDWVLKAKETIDKVAGFVIGFCELAVFLVQRVFSTIIVVLGKILGSLSPSTIVVAALVLCLFVFAVTAIEWWKIGWEVAKLCSIASGDRWVWALSALTGGTVLNMMQLAKSVAELFTNSALAMDGPLGDFLMSIASGMNSIDAKTKGSNQTQLFFLELAVLVCYQVISGGFVKAFAISVVTGLGVVAWLGFMVRAQDMVFNASAKTIKTFAN